MKFPALLALLATSASLLGFVALPPRWVGTLTVTPPPGKYTGLLTVRRALIQEGLETTFTLKAEASIAADGRITILTATPESPGAAANIENSIVRAVPIPAVPPPDVTFAKPATDGRPLPIRDINSSVLRFVLPSNYQVNGNTPALVALSNRQVRLTYSVEQSQLPITTTLPPGVGTVASSSPTGTSVAVPPQVTSRVSYEFLLRLQGALPAANATPRSP